MVESCGAFVPSEFCGCGRLRRGVVGVASVVVSKATPHREALTGAERMKEGDKDVVTEMAVRVEEYCSCARRVRAWSPYASW